LSPDTRQSYRESTDEFLAVVGPQRATDLTAQDLDRYLVALNSASRARGLLSVATRGARIARVRAWLNWAWHEGDLMTALGGQLRPPSVPVTTPPPLPLAQIRAMLGRVSLRNQVLLLILLDTALRIGDALRLRRTDLCHMQDGQPYFEVAVSKTHSGGQPPISATTERVLRPLSSPGVPAAVAGGVGRPSLSGGRPDLLFATPLGPTD
jgi:site-specific recombinase XerD